MQPRGAHFTPLSVAELELQYLPVVQRLNELGANAGCRNFSTHIILDSFTKERFLESSKLLWLSKSDGSQDLSLSVRFQTLEEILRSTQGDSVFLSEQNIPFFLNTDLVTDPQADGLHVDFAVEGGQLMLMGYERSGDQLVWLSSVPADEVALQDYFASQCESLHVVEEDDIDSEDTYSSGEI